MSATVHGFTTDAERIADELISQRRDSSEDFVQSSYAGLHCRMAQLARKYRGHEYVSVGSTRARRLSPAELDEFRAHVQRCIDPSLRTVPTFRKAVV